MEFNKAKSVALVVGATCGIFLTSGCAPTESQASSSRRLSQARQAHRSEESEPVVFDPPPAEQQNITLVARQDFGGRGNFGDVWVHKKYAYVGSYRSAHCPGHGVSVADVHNPTRPTAVSTFAAHPHTSAEDLEVISMRSRHFRGTLAAVGLQDCSETEGAVGQRGLELWDTTDPRRPTRLSFVPTSTSPQGGVHELDVFERGGRYYVILATNFFAVEGPDQPGPVRILDVTDPRAPVPVSDWHIGRDAGLAYGSPLFTDAPPGNCEAPPGGTSDCRTASSGGYPVVSAHSASVNRDGTRAFISYWDAGMVVLDLRDLAHPRMIGRGNSGPDEEGDLHSSIEVPYFGGNVAITTDEDWSPVFNTEADPHDVWGFARVWDLSNPARPVQVARIESPHSASNRADGYYSVHNPVAYRNLAFFSWYTDGVRVYDLATPSRPRLLGFFDAPRVPDPHAHSEHPNPTGAFWGIVVRPPFIYASDMNAGLYVLRMGAPILASLRSGGDDPDDRDDD